MPLPNPIKNEKQDDYVSRCISFVKSESPDIDNDQAVAMCHSQWREARGGKKPEKMKSMQGAEIMRPGLWEAETGTVNIKDKTIDDIIVNFDNKVLEPYINLDHDDKFTKRVNDNFEKVNIGLVERLYKKGKSLIADFKEVPDKIAELIKSGQLKFKSPEFFKNITRNEKVYHNVLKAISFFGADIPAQDLDDYILIKEQYNKNDEVVKLIELKSNKEVKIMDIEKKEYEELIKAKATGEINEMKAKASDDTNKELQNEIIKLKKEKDDFRKEKDDEISKLKKENNDFKSEKESVEKMKADIEKEKEEDLNKEAGKYINDKIGEEKLLPKYKETYVKDYIIKAKVNDDSLKLFKEDIENRGKVIELKEIQKPSGNVDPNAIDLNDNEAVEEAIQMKMKQLKAKGESGDLWEKANKMIMSEEV